MKEYTERKNYQRAELLVVLLPTTDVIACSSLNIPASASNSDDGGWTR